MNSALETSKEGLGECVMLQIMLSVWPVQSPLLTIRQYLQMAGRFCLCISTTVPSEVLVLQRTDKHPGKGWQEEQRGKKEEKKKETCQAHFSLSPLCWNLPFFHLSLAVVMNYA